MTSPRAVVRTIRRHPQILVQGLVSIVLGLLALALVSAIAGDWAILADYCWVALLLGVMRVVGIANGVNAARTD